MANAEKGEVAREIGGTTYTFCFDLQAIELAQEELSTPETAVDLLTIFKGLGQQRLKYGRCVFWASLQRYQPGTSMAQACELMNETGGFAVLWSLMHEIANLAMPTESDVKEMATINPPKARAKRKRRTGPSAVFTSVEAKSA